MLADQVELADGEPTCRHCGQPVAPGWTIICDKCRQPLAPGSPPAVPSTSGQRPIWALPVIVLGLLAAAGALAFDALYVIRHSEAPSRYDSFALLPTVLLVPLGAILLAIGGLALIRPAVQERPWLRVVVLGAILVWAVAACFGPSLLTGPVQAAI